MARLSYVFLVFLFSLIQSHTLPKSVTDYNNYLTIEQKKTLTSNSAIAFIEDGKFENTPEKFLYKVVSPKNYGSMDNDGVIDEKKQLHDFVIIRSHTQMIDKDPFELIERLDQIKYMVLWLNFYCGMHPDCNRMKLNEELKKMVSTVVLQNYTH